MTTSGFIIGAVLVLAPIILVICLAIGLFGFKPERAEAIRAGEAESPVLIEEIRRIHVGPPDRFRRGRIDRHPFYIGPHFAALGYSICIMSGAPVTNNVAALSDLQRLTMAACFLIGSSLSLTGAGMGLRVWKWTLVAGIADHIAAARLGDDVRLPYTFGAIGVFASGMSMGIYATTSFSTTTGSLGGWLTALIAGACIAMIFCFLRRIRQYSVTLKVIVHEAVANVIRRGEHELE